MLKKLVSLLLIVVLFTISSFSSAFAVPTSNMLPKISSIDAEQKSAIEYDRFLKDVNNFKKFIQAQRSKQGSLSDDAFLLKCAIEYHNQKVSNGELEGPLLDINEIMNLKTSSSQVSIKSVGITKSLVRAQLWTAAELASIVVPKASFFLQHSLQDNPSDEYLPSSDSIVPEIKGTQAYKNAIAPFKSSSSTSQISYPVFTASNSNWDLYLALHNTTMYSYSSGKSITSYVTDTYDFQPKNWSGYGSGIPNAAVTLINNYGAYAQSVGAVVPYYISITVPDTK
ncbi:hypothetical protein [Thermoanaerobacterium thermosaccharolyticum]|uniref:SCP domain-containing protein n=1 Tax=Thermoanaerobacterium thermosaccharolyticum TaxID=1517 RepID=A0A231VH03_THETR|nr:hypothetical protein [Thermoanaerobacterium thermosaccharolyticum]KAA5806330.1 hypothetical protein F1655_10130 [Thermoanaerobacterium thermosaccharolyticum]OXT07271.1 hypothetical protein CE561_08710 [Thermoanaerobacterium thermosaccharolyticum]